MSVTLRHNLISSVLCLLVVTAGCSSPALSSKGTQKGTTVHTVNVGSSVEPLQINAGRGDEVRWINNRSQPIVVLFPKSDESRTSCRSGFRNIDSVLSAVVPPNASASMCFSELGKYDYTVRLDENLAAAETDRTASVWIVGRGQRNPKPGEQFENVTP
jgi:plastocyanin